MKYIHSLQHILKESDVGAKAAGLSQLINWGVCVPTGFAIDKTAQLLYARENQFPNEFKEEITACTAELKHTEVIVRSSAIGEDSAEHSFAGQLDSFVVLNNPDDILDAVLKCWAGLENDRVKAYQDISGKKLSEMGVVIQEFVNAEYAGVTFTRSPFQADEIYTEYVRGDGEQLVSGKVTPQGFSVAEEVEVIDPKIPFNTRELIRQARQLKDFYQCHLDIEWVSTNGTIHFVQARPITVTTEEKVHWSNTNLNENYPDPISPLLYSIARDSYYHYFKNLAVLLQLNKENIRALEYDFSNTVGIFGNRIYYNMTSIHNIMAASPLKAYFVDAFNKFVGYEDKDAGSQQRVKKSSLLKLVRRLLKLNFQLNRHVQDIEHLVGAYAVKEVKQADLKRCSQLFYEFLDLRFKQWYHASLADMFSMIHYKLLGKFTQRFYGEQSIGMHNTLVQAIPGLISSEPLNDTWDLIVLIRERENGERFFLQNPAEEVYAAVTTQMEWNTIHEKIKNYLEKWGFRCSGELMFFTENYAENPVKFIELVQSYMRHSSENPREVIAQKSKERKKAMREFSKKILRKRHLFFPVALVEIGQLYLLTALCKQAISSRERVRYRQAQMYFQFKKTMKRTGELFVENQLLHSVSDIFFLNYKEIGELLASSDMFSKDAKQRIENRKKTFKIESEKQFPHSFSCAFGTRPECLEEKIPLAENATEFCGLAASGGRIKAKVKVLDSVLEAGKLEKGDILVTRQTDPGWAMVFPMIGGLIVERGGALSHGAIVAREFGIPAVIGIDRIVEMLNDNDEVILDGDLGKIQKI